MVSGKTIRFSWTDGPTKGKTYEHIFHPDGTVEWGGSDDRTKYADEAVTEKVSMISYLSKSGYTLTAVLNFENGTIVGVASNETTWIPVHGTLTVTASVDGAR